MNNHLFRQKALERLQSPDELDQAVTVVSSKGWVALTGIAFFVISAIIWGFIGELPYRITGKGMLIKSGGIKTITHIASGRVTDVRVKENDIIHKGDVIARIEQTDILERLQNARNELDIFKKNRQKLEKLTEKSDEVGSKISNQKVLNIQSNIDTLEKKLKFLRDKQKDQYELLRDGIITTQMVSDTELEISNTESQISSLKNQVKGVDLENISLQVKRQQEISTINEKIRSMEKQITSLKQDFIKNSRIVSPYNGRVIEVNIQESDVVSPGNSVIKLELEGKDVKKLVAVAYVPAEKGKKVKYGMEAQIAPSTVRKEEHGTIVSNVVQISDYPVSTEEMYKTIGNKILIQALVEQGPLIQVFSDLQIDTTTPSGLKWTSKNGPDHEIFSGTMCDVTITVKRDRPISLVIPALRKILGI